MTEELTLEQQLLRKVGLEGQRLSQGESQALIERITSADLGPEEYIAVGALLCAMNIRGESAEEIAGAAMALLRAMRSLDLHSECREYYDIVGTGGDGKSTVSVSTAASIALAAVGREQNDGDLAVAKHGNRAVSGKVGSADVLRECGVNFDGDEAQLRKQFGRHGFLFLFAPFYHASMRYVAPVRAALKFPTIFNLLGPLCNPSNPDGAAIGVSHVARLESMSEAARLLGKKNYFFYSSEDGYDEISTAAPSHIFCDGKLILSVEPKDFFAPFVLPQVVGLQDSVNKFRYMLSGAAGTPDCSAQAAGIDADLGLRLHWTVCLNTALPLYLFGKVVSLKEAFALVDSLLRQGAGARKLEELQQ